MRDAEISPVIFFVEPIFSLKRMHCILIWLVLIPKNQFIMLTFRPTQAQFYMGPITRWYVFAITIIHSVVTVQLISAFTFPTWKSLWNRSIHCNAAYIEIILHPCCLHTLSYPKTEAYFLLGQKSYCSAVYAGIMMLHYAPCMLLSYLTTSYVRFMLFDYAVFILHYLYIYLLHDK